MSRLPADRAQTLLLRALTPVAGPFALVAARSTPWSSATFEGARHRLALRLEGDDAAARAARLRTTLSERDLPMRGAFVADLVVAARIEGGATTLGIEALTIDEDPGYHPVALRPVALSPVALRPVALRPVAIRPAALSRGARPAG